jgi:pre-mRNA-splicing factor ATP-dependent RNA helicase DHX16
MAEFPVDPQLSKSLLASESLGCSEEMVTVASMVSCGSAVFYTPKDRKVIAQNAHRNFYRGAKGDHIALLAVFRDWAEADFSGQWCVENFVQARRCSFLQAACAWQTCETLRHQACMAGR